MTTSPACTWTITRDTTLAWCRDSGSTVGRIGGLAAVGHLSLDSARDFLGPYIQIFAQDIEMIEQAVYLFGGVMCGIHLPFGWWSNTTGQWNMETAGDGSICGSHCVMIGGFNHAAQTFDAYSWGWKYTVSYEGFQNFFFEVFAAISPDWLTTGGALAGIEYDRLLDDMEAMTGIEKPWTPCPSPCASVVPSPQTNFAVNAADALEMTEMVNASPRNMPKSLYDIRKMQLRQI